MSDIGAEESKNKLVSSGSRKNSRDVILEEDHDRIEVDETEDEGSTGKIIESDSNKGDPSRSKCFSRKMKIILSTTLILLVFSGLGVSCLFRNPTLLMYPLHASCNITYTFSLPCKEVLNKLEDQIDKWKTDETCGTGQKCLYTLSEVKNKNAEDGQILYLTHMTPVRKYIDDMEFRFYRNTVTEGCNVIGFSSSRLWYALLDLGTNYCNLHNLVDGAGLQDDPQYSELTKDSVCTQYTSSNCEKY